MRGEHGPENAVLPLKHPNIMMMIEVYEDHSEQKIQVLTNSRDIHGERR